MCARGESAVAPYFVMVRALTPARARRADAVRPAGPAPATRTSVSISSIGHHSGDQIGPIGPWHNENRTPGGPNSCQEDRLLLPMRRLRPCASFLVFSDPS